MKVEDTYQTIKDLVAKYVDINFKDDENLLLVTSVRNIIYIIYEMEEIFKFSIDSRFINDTKLFSVDNLVKLVIKNVDELRIS